MNKKEEEEEESKNQNSPKAFGELKMNKILTFKKKNSYL